MPTFNDLLRRIAALETKVAALQLPTSTGGVQWRRPRIVVSEQPPDNTTAKTGVIKWSPIGVLVSVQCRIDGGPSKPAPSTGIAYGPLMPGMHRADFYVAGETTAEASCTWTIKG